MGNAEYMGLTNTKKKMKFATIKLILSLITIGMVLSTNTMRSKAMDSGKGTWEAGYVCPKIFLTEGNGDSVDQGEATIMAPTLVEPKTPATKLGLNLKFKNAPAADSLMVKIGTKYPKKFTISPSDSCLQTWLSIIQSETTKPLSELSSPTTSKVTPSKFYSPMPHLDGTLMMTNQTK